MSRESGKCPVKWVQLCLWHESPERVLTTGPTEEDTQPAPEAPPAGEADADVGAGGPNADAAAVDDEEAPEEAAEKPDEEASEPVSPHKATSPAESAPAAPDGTSEEGCAGADDADGEGEEEEGEPMDTETPSVSEKKDKRARDKSGGGAPATKKRRVADDGDKPAPAPESGPRKTRGATAPVPPSPAKKAPASPSNGKTGTGSRIGRPPKAGRGGLASPAPAPSSGRPGKKGTKDGEGGAEAPVSWKAVRGQKKGSPDDEDMIMEEEKYKVTEPLVLLAASVTPDWQLTVWRMLCEEVLCEETV